MARGLYARGDGAGAGQHQGAASKKFPDVKFTKAGVDRAGTYFQLYGKDRAGKDVEFIADEKISQVVSTVYVPLKLDELPEPIRKGHQKTMEVKSNRTKRFEAAKIVRADETREFFPGDEKKSWYELYGKNAKGEIVMDRITPETAEATRRIFRRPAGNLFPEESPAQGGGPAGAGTSRKG